MIGSKLNHTTAQQYSHSFASIIIDNFFSQQDGIRGQEIVNLTPVKQVNFFILKNLFTQWQEETKKLDSPFFDYASEEVKTALANMGNILSQHIYIKKDDFKPLLEVAVMETLELLYEPSSYYSNRPKQVIGNENAAADTKYFKIYKPIYETLIAASNLDQAAIEQIVSAAELSEEEFQENVSAFKTIQPIPANIINVETNNIVDVSPSLFDEIVDDEPQPVVEPVQVDESKVDEEIDVEEGISNLNAQFAEEDIQTLNQKYEEQLKEETIASKHEEESIESLSSSISINQRYMFVNDLFDGNEPDYLQAISEVDQSDSFDDSVEIMVSKYARKYNWDMNSDEVKGLLKIIFKRFR